MSKLNILNKNTQSSSPLATPYSQLKVFYRIGVYFCQINRKGTKFLRY